MAKLTVSHFWVFFQHLFTELTRILKLQRDISFEALSWAEIVENLEEMYIQEQQDKRSKS